MPKASQKARKSSASRARSATAGLPVVGREALREVLGARPVPGQFLEAPFEHDELRAQDHATARHAGRLAAALRAAHALVRLAREVVQFDREPAVFLEQDRRGAIESEAS